MPGFHSYAEQKNYEEQLESIAKFGPVKRIELADVERERIMQGALDALESCAQYLTARDVANAHLGLEDIEPNYSPLTEKVIDASLQLRNYLTRQMGAQSVGRAEALTDEQLDANGRSPDHD
jgi:hypothetical protein